LRSWSWYLREKKLRKQWKKLNSCHKTMATMTTTTTIMEWKKKTMRLKKNAMMEKMKMMRTTLL
jgi:hypothetical protein